MVRIVFIHPDLGIGGAERLIIDAALALKSKNHNVNIVTSHHDVNHCFIETKNGDLNVISVGDWLPRTLFGKCAALCATIRMFWAAFYLTVMSDLAPEVIICDQISNAIPILRLFSKAKIIFYCHFPDMLLTQRKNLMKKLYRKVMDNIEEYTTGKADLILVNSHFTKGVFHDTFTSLRILNPSVLHPSLNTVMFDNLATKSDKDSTSNDNSTIFLSINRYERKKNIALAIQAFEHLLKKQNQKKCDSLKLVIAGGYDLRVPENVEYHSELKTMAEKAGIGSQVEFLQSPSDQTKVELLQTSDCLLYTPSGEHFGIVPIEAMYNELPVIAVNDGGPMETVVDGETGFLKRPDPVEFAEAMNLIVEGGSELKNELGKNGRRRVLNNFAFNAFANKLNDYIDQVMES